MTDKPKPKYAAHGEPGTEAWIEVYADTCAEAEKRHAIYAHAPEMFEAMKQFVARVEAGEILSRTTYRMFRDILAKITK